MARELTPSEAKAFAERYPSGDLRGHPAMRLEAATRIQAERLAGLLQPGRHLAHIEEEPVGVLAWTDDAWDSERLQWRCGRLTLACGGSHLVHMVREWQERTDREYVVARLPSSELASVRALESCGFQTVDGLLTFARETQRFADITARRVLPEEAEALGDLAQDTFSMGRFHDDPLVLPDQAKSVYLEWAANSAKGLAADAVFVTEDGEGLTAAATVRLDLPLGVAWLPLVFAAERARGAGSAVQCVKAALEWSLEQGCALVAVGTQVGNLPAARLYEKLGFLLSGSSVTLRWAKRS